MTKKVPFAFLFVMLIVLALFLYPNTKNQVVGNESLAAHVADDNELPLSNGGPSNPICIWWSANGDKWGGGSTCEDKGCIEECAPWITYKCLTDSGIRTYHSEGLYCYNRGNCGDGYTQLFYVYGDDGSREQGAFISSIGGKAVTFYVPAHTMVGGFNLDNGKSGSQGCLISWWWCGSFEWTSPGWEGELD